MQTCFLVGKYMRMMTLLEPIAFQVITSMSQLFDLPSLLPLFHYYHVLQYSFDCIFLELSI